MDGWIGVDLDGTLAHYDGWKGAGHIGAPVKLMVDRVKGWLAEGKTVKIFTARVSRADGSPERYNEAQLARIVILEWTLKHFGQALEVTNEKDYAMVELWDDRAIQVKTNTGIPVIDSEEVIEIDQNGKITGPAGSEDFLAGVAQLRNPA